MIIFELDNVLANCDHRKHFVDRYHPINENRRLSEISLVSTPEPDPNPYIWKPDYAAYDSACEADEPIQPVIRILKEFQVTYPECENIQIWTGRSESMRIDTHVWLMKYAGFEPCRDTVKMRPLGNNEPVCDLKERWLFEHNNTIYPPLTKNIPDIKEFKRKDPIEMVFEADPASIAMYRKHGIFVFDCRQREKSSIP